LQFTPTAGSTATHSRREFLRTSAAAAAGTAIGANALSPHQLLGAPRPQPSPGDPAVRELMQVALDAARSAGASYADVRVAARRQQFIATREAIAQGISDGDTFGLGVRTLIDGAWGFAATNVMTKDSVAQAAKAAATQSRANRASMLKPVILAPTPGKQVGEWKSPIKVDPFTIPVADTVALLLEANAAALTVKGVRNVSSFVSFMREEKSLMTTDDTFVVQTIYRANPSMNITAVSADFSDFQNRSSTDLAPMGLGYEYLIDSKLKEKALMWGQQAVEKLSAKPVEPGRYDLVLHPSHLWLTIHESVSHPTELDRVMGYEANYAGTSFAAPPEDMLGKLKYGSDLMNIQGDRDQPGSLGAIGWDDEGVKPSRFDIIKDGLLVDYQTTREQASMLEWYYKKVGKPVKSYGCSYSQSWSDVQFQRMPNVSLLPGKNDYVFEDLISQTDKGIAIIGDGSFSIDQQRYNGQFAGQVFYEIKGGKLNRMLKDVAYQFRTPQFWASMDAIGGPRSYYLGGTFSDGKGQPSQSNAASHGCVPARFRQVNVLNTGRKA
jgi:TldD protein